MRIRVILPVVLAASLSAACGSHQAATSATRPVGTQPVTSTSRPAPSTPAASPTEPAPAKFENFSTTTKGLAGRIDYREDDGSAGTAHFTGSFGFDQDFSQPSSGQLQLQAMTQPPVPVSIRAVDKTMYFRARSDPWTQVTGLETNPTLASDGVIAATLLGSINPSNWSDLVKAAGGKVAESSTAAGIELRGQADVFQAVATMGAYSANLPVRLPQRWPSPVSFTIDCTSTGQLIKASEVLSGPTGSATIAITVTGYTSPAVVAP